VTTPSSTHVQTDSISTPPLLLLLLLTKLTTTMT